MATRSHAQLPAPRAARRAPVRRATGRAGTVRVAQRHLLPLLVVPTVLIGGLIGFCFAIGASPPDGLLRQPRTAPWDYLTSTKVLDERVLPEPAAGADAHPADPVAAPGPTVLGAPRTNGHGPGRTAG